MEEQDIKLTKLTKCAGCGAKVGAGVLAQLLEGIRVHHDPNLLVGFDKSDDASVYKINDELALVQTVDFFPPIADDPYLFGQIAATNALSDVYAMGGVPKLCLNIMAVPEDMPRETVHQILRGGYDKVYEAGALITGGHSILDDEPKYGLAVTGFVHPDKLLSNSAARPGDVLVLTKPIGIGVLCAQMCGAEDWMRLRCMNATALLGGAALTLVIAAVGIVCSVPLLRAQGTEEAVCREAAVYLQLVFAGLICCFLYNYYASMLRSCGNSRTPFVILLVSSTLHALLDVLFVGVLAWGIRGVACSTVLCQAFSAAWCILYAERRCPPLTLKRSELRFERRMGGMVLSYAWAAALQQAVVCIGRLLVQGMLTPLGTNTVTGYNMSLRIEQFLFCFSQGVSAAMVVCLSQNLGHGDRVRVRRFYRVSVCVEAALIAVLGTVCFLFPSQIVGLFSDNGEVIAAGARYTGTMAYLYLFAYMGEVIQGFFRGLGRLRLTMVASLLQVVLRVVLSYFLIPVWGMYGICVAVASGWVLLVLIEGSYSVRTARALTMEKREE